MPTQIYSKGIQAQNNQGLFESLNALGQNLEL
jgi:hypothetical protein